MQTDLFRFYLQSVFIRTEWIKRGINQKQLEMNRINYDN